MKQIEFKEVAHLYLGCEAIETLHDNKCILNEVRKDGTCHVVGDFLFTDLLAAHYIKPLLHPLSSMTEDEAIELFKNISLLDLSECTFDFIEDEGSFCINAEIRGRVIDAMEMRINSDLVYMMNNNGSFSPLNPQSEATLFFLLKHFDLFNLIENNQAIDATKTEHVNQ
jgi:hypothetical protein